MSKGLRVIKENNNLVEWSRQVEECRSSGLSVRSWCEQNGIAVSTFHYRQQKVWDALQERNQFVEVPLQVNEYRNENIAATVHIGEIRADIHNGADEATLTALVHALKSCRTTFAGRRRFTSLAATRICVAALTAWRPSWSSSFSSIPAQTPCSCFVEGGPTV